MKNWAMTNKGHQKFWGLNIDFFLTKGKIRGKFFSIFRVAVKKLASGAGIPSYPTGLDLNMIPTGEHS